ncbi:MAG TPA: iron-containing alcohol dehydrogenase, partial [Gemmatimonadaceae bacterium]|nr:iron-containing alcohol dehydrogenase [Gemmatimonadaceae bacterium]
TDDGGAEAQREVPRLGPGARRVGVPGVTLAFDFAAPTRVVFGAGRAAECAGIAATIGGRALVMRGGGDRASTLVQQLRDAGVFVATQSLTGEPTVALVERVAAVARQDRIDVVIAVGGGSVIDAGKAVAALATNPGAARDYLEVVGHGRSLAQDPLPVIAIPTTAGTGAEVTRNAVLMAEEERVKVSLRSPRMLPVVAILDPALTLTLPPAATASTGLDALTQCIEPFVTPFATPVTDAVAREGMLRASRALPRAVHDGSDLDARADMLVAALMSGIALANAKLGAVHGFAAPLGGMFPVPHGVACARLLPEATRVNVRALRARAPESPALARYTEVARVLTGNPAARAEDAAPWLAALVEQLGVPRLASFGVHAGDFPRVVAAARSASSMKGNPIVLDDAELAEVLGGAV